MYLYITYTVRSRIIGTPDENEQKGLYKINNTDHELYFMLIYLYTFIVIQFLFFFLNVLATVALGLL